VVGGCVCSATEACLASWCTSLLGGQKGASSIQSAPFFATTSTIQLFSAMAFLIAFHLNLSTIARSSNSFHHS
jgi:hypothetical protein